MSRIAALSAVLVSLSAGSVPAAEMTAEDLAGATALSEAFAAAMVAGDMDAVAAMYTEDAILCPPNEPMMQGRDRIRAFLDTFPKCTDMKLENVVSQGCDETAYFAGVFMMTLEIPGVGSVQEAGKYLDVRRKGEDGVWRFVADAYNSSIPLPAPDSGTE